MAWVYILQGNSGRHYIGSTTDLARRRVEHERGHTQTTARLGHDLQLVACRELDSLANARALERTLKRKKNPRLALWLLNHGLDTPSATSSGPRSTAPAPAVRCFAPGWQASACRLLGGNERPLVPSTTRGLIIGLLASVAVFGSRRNGAGVK